MLKWEFKKILSKRMNLVMISAVFLLAIVFSCFAIGSVRYVDENGVTHTGVTAARSLAGNRNATLLSGKGFLGYHGYVC